MTWPRSLALRLALATGLWVAVGLGGAASFLIDVVAHQVEAAFNARLAGLLDAAVAAAAVGPEGRIVVGRAPAGADFDRPFSGAYWQITAPDGTVATSRSLWDQVLPAVAGNHVGEPIYRDARGPRGQPIRIALREVRLPEAPAPARLAVALSRAGMDGEIGQLRRLLALTFGVLGLGLVGGVVATVVVGLAPLRRVRRALAAVRAGSRTRLGIDAPAEIAPLVGEVDALIAANQATVERARAHLGNLAHALKTPLAVLRNALDPARPDLALARTETAALERLVQHHLARARTTALVAAGAAAAAAPQALAEAIAGALRRLFAGRGLAITVAGDAAIEARIDPQDLTEMLGNLMENACTWARSRVGVSITATGDTVVIAVGDDGPGLTAQGRAAALGRGVRLDERGGGTGLGLAIVADLAALHGGSFELGEAPEGGLSAVLRLPRRGSHPGRP